MNGTEGLAERELYNDATKRAKCMSRYHMTVIMISRFGLEYNCRCMLLRQRVRAPVFARNLTINQLLRKKRKRGPKMASADDFEDHVESTAVPGKQHTIHFPPSNRPNACMSTFTCSNIRV